jgi:hypothetical protein
MHIEEKQIFLWKLFMEWQMIYNLFLTMRTKIIKSYTFRKRNPLKVKECVSVLDFLPVLTIPSLIQTLLHQLWIVSSNHRILKIYEDKIYYFVLFILFSLSLCYRYFIILSFYLLLCFQYLFLILFTA